MKQIVIKSIDEIEKYRHELEKIKIWVCNTSCGKSYLCQIDDRFLGLDYYLSTLNLGSDERNKRMTIVKTFRELEKGKIVLNASHRYYLSYLAENNIPFVYMYPRGELEAEYVEQMRHRGSTEEFIKLYGGIAEDYNKRKDDPRGTFKIEMNKGEFVSDYVWKVFGKPQKFINFISPPKQEFKVAFIDVDDTLVDINGNLSPFTKKVILSLKGKIKIVLTSGRSNLGLMDLANELELQADDIMIENNGGLIVRNNGEILYESPMSPADIKFFVSNFNAPHSGITFNTKSGYINLSSIQNLNKFLAETAVFKICYKSDTPLKKEDIPKIIKQKFICYGSGPYYFITKNISKEKAARQVLKLLRLSPSDAIAFGNSKNLDLGFMKLAGCSVAVCNSDELIKKHATYIADSNNDDGVAKSLLKLIK